VTEETYHVSKERTAFTFVRNIDRFISADSIDITFTLMMHSFEGSALLGVNLKLLRRCEGISHEVWVRCTVIVHVELTYKMCLTYVSARATQENNNHRGRRRRRRRRLLSAEYSHIYLK
jgi:hypothetical protein